MSTLVGIEGAVDQLPSAQQEQRLAFLAGGLWGVTRSHLPKHGAAGGARSARRMQLWLGETLDSL